MSSFTERLREGKRKPLGVRLMNYDPHNEVLTKAFDENNDTVETFERSFIGATGARRPASE